MATKHEEQIDQVYNFLSAYEKSVADAAINLFYNNLEELQEASEKQMVDDITRSKLVLFEGKANEIPPNHEWFVVNKKIYIRSHADRDFVLHEIEEEYKKEKRVTGVVGSNSTHIKKTDLSMKQTDKLCMYCGGTLVFEPICPGCKLGRLGFKGRFVCMEDMDHEFYVLREGIILPNQGD